MGIVANTMPLNGERVIWLSRVCMQDISLKDVKRVTVLGAGAFGQVLLVKAGTQYFALKCLNKEQIVKMGLQASCCPHILSGNVHTDSWRAAGLNLHCRARPPVLCSGRQIVHCGCNVCLCTAPCQPLSELLARSWA